MDLLKPETAVETTIFDRATMTRVDSLFNKPGVEYDQEPSIAPLDDNIEDALIEQITPRKSTSAAMANPDSIDRYVEPINQSDLASPPASQKSEIIQP